MGEAVLLTAVKGVLVVCARTIGDLNPGPALVCVLKQVDVRSLIKAMMGRVISWGTVKVMNVAKACREKKESDET